jgi:hypothetical protein
MIPKGHTDEFDCPSISELFKYIINLFGDIVDCVNLL